MGIAEVRRLASEYSGMLIIPGVEITTDKGDIVLLGTEELPPMPWTIENVVDYAKEIAGISIAVHPFREFGLGELSLSSRVDAIEVLNGASSVEANRCARDLAKRLNLPGVAGSDSHGPHELFSVYTEVESSLSVDEILHAIGKGLVSVPF